MTLRRIVVLVFVVCSMVAVCELQNVQTTAPAGVRNSAFDAAPSKGRVVILGFDGVEPTIVDAMLTAGELPNIAKLREQGCFQRLGSSNPPQSPTAWSSFATCLNPGNHGIYDFLRRDPARYAPGLGFGITKHPELAPDGSLSKAAEYQNYRKGDTFWGAASAQGARSKLLIVPFAYPAEPLQDGCQLCGLDVPDVRGTQSTFFAMSDQFDKQQNLGGGVRLPLQFTGDTATVMLPGPRHPTTREFIEAPINVTVDRAAHKAVIDLQGKTVELAEGAWSAWLEWTFKATDQFAIHAISRIHVLEVGESVRLYMTCLQIHPKKPYMQISTPPSYAGEVADRHGLYRTVGWAYDTKALEKSELTEDLFLEDAMNQMAWNEMLMMDELGRGNFEMLVAAWTATDRIAHMFWRYRDPKHPLYTPEGAKQWGRAVENSYVKMDEIIGKAMAALGEEDLLMVISDHGFHSFRTGFSLNTWLVRNGYLTLKGQTDPATAYTKKKYMSDFDWSKTRAYGLGLGSMFLNLEGRERDGVVSTEEAPALLKEIQSKLLAVVDPQTGEKVMGGVYLQSDVYTGRAEKDAPDIQLGFAEGYQMAKPSAAGAAPPDVLSPNTSKWSGDHAASDVAITPGILFSNKPLGKEPSILDIGVTALSHLKLSVPKEFEGKSLLPSEPAAKAAQR